MTAKVTNIYNLKLTPSQFGQNSIVVNCSQYDSLFRIIQFNLFNGNAVYSIPEGSVVTIRGTKKDNTGFEYECDFYNNVVTFPIQQQITIFPGKVPAELRIVNDGEIIGSWNFLFLVEESPLSDETTISETQLPLLEQAIEAADRLNEAFDDITEFTDETYPNAVEAIQSEGATQVANVTNEGTTQRGLVSSEGATQIASIQAEGTTQVGNVQAKGDEVIASIPSDYTELSGEVEDLKSILEGKINLESGTFTDATGTTKVSMASRLRTVSPLYVGTIGLIEIADGYEAYVFLLDSALQKIGTLAWASTIRQSSIASAEYINFSIRKSGATSQDISADVSIVENGTTLYSTQQIDIADAKTKIDGLFNVSFSENGYIGNTGANAGTSTSFRRTDYIPLSGVLFGIEYAMCLDSNGNIVSFYDENKLYLGGVAGAGNNVVKTGVLEYPDGAKYVRFSYCVASAGITNPEPVIRLKDIPQYSGVGSNAVKTSSIVDNAVTREKCSFIIHDPETNYINKSDYSEGYINANGAFVSNTGWRATGFCALLPETQYFSSGLHGGYCAFYKADKTVIAGYGANAFTVTNFTTPAETAYARFSLNASSQSVDTAWINIKNEKPEDYGYILDGIGISSNVDNPCDYDGREIAVFNKILCVGDSMTEGTFNHLDSGATQWVSYSKYSYPTYLHKMTGVDVTNLGHGGQTSVQWYNTEQNSDLSGYDCAIIQLGINDYGTYGELGTDTKTAFQNIITKLKTENKNIKIFVANIIPATSYSSTGYKAYSSSLLEWLETTYATDPSVIPVDIQQYGHTGDSEAYNAGHLTALGYRMLARDYIGFISNYIKNNGSVFREVQFIGTDYWYVNPNS